MAFKTKSYFCLTLFVHPRNVKKVKSDNSPFAIILAIMQNFSLNVYVAAHRRGMRPTPSSDKDILKPHGKLKTLNTTDYTHN